MYNIKTTSNIDRIFLKLSKKNPKQMIIIDKKVGKNPIWVCICTKDDLIYSGYVKRQELLTDNKKAIYIKDVLLMNSEARDYRINEFEGMLFVEDNIK